MVQRIFKLRRGDIQRTGQRCEEDKRTDKQPDIEMEATQQVSPCRARSAGSHTFPF